MSLYEELTKQFTKQAPPVTRRSKPALFTPEVAAARDKERTRRAAKAQRQTRTILSKRHSDEYRELYVALLAEINAEAGPLPGDPE